MSSGRRYSSRRFLLTCWSQGRELIADLLAQTAIAASTEYAFLDTPACWFDSSAEIVVYLKWALYWDWGCDAEGCISEFCRKNGKYLGVAFRNIVNMPLFPTIGLHR